MLQKKYTNTNTNTYLTLTRVQGQGVKIKSTKRKLVNALKKQIIPIQITYRSVP